MRSLVRLAVSGWLVALGLAALISAPVAGADCNDSSGTVVCAQGDIRGTHAPPPARPAYGPGFGYGCGYLCYGGGGGFPLIILGR
jgi:hypothetical protein